MRTKEEILTEAEKKFYNSGDYMNVELKDYIARSVVLAAMEKYKEEFEEDYDDRQFEARENANRQ